MQDLSSFRDNKFFSKVLNEEEKIAYKLKILNLFFPSET